MGNNKNYSDVAVADVTADAGEDITRPGNVESDHEQSNLHLTPEKQDEFDRCNEVLDRHKKNVPSVAKAIATIDREKYYMFSHVGKFKSASDYIHEIFGLERTYIHRMKKYGGWLLDTEVPEGREPAETSVREMLQNGFSAEDRKKIYHDAREICCQRRKKDAKKSSSGSEEKSNSDPESSCDNARAGMESRVAVAPEEINQTVPEAKDVRKAIREFQKASGRIFFPLLANMSYAKDTPFQQILKENADKFRSIRTVLDCFRHYKDATNMELVPIETAQAIQKCIAALITEAQNEMAELLRSSSSSSDSATI